MKFPVRIRQDENQFVLDAIPAFALLLSYDVLDRVRGDSVDAVCEQTAELLKCTLKEFMASNEYVGLPRKLEVYQKSDLHLIDNAKVWATVDVELLDLGLPSETLQLSLPQPLAQKLRGMAEALDSTPDMMLSMLLAHFREEGKKTL